MNFQAFWLTSLFVLSTISGCLTANETSEQAELRLATTTSMRDSGVLDLLIQEFKEAHDIEVEYVAVGTGAALVLGENKDVDALLVHAPSLEMQFIEEGHGTNRTMIAWNRFVLLSPQNFNGSIFDVFETINNEEQCFISRGDFSGTHHKEQAIWRALNETRGLEVTEDSNGLHPSGEWYYSIGQGMGAAINMANEKNCATLSDRGTALNFQEDVELLRLEFTDEHLYNPYSFIELSGPESEAANLFLEYLLGPGQLTIERYEIKGEAAFFSLGTSD